MSVLEEPVRGWTEEGAREGLIGYTKVQYDKFRSKKAQDGIKVQSRRTQIISEGWSRLRSLAERCADGKKVRWWGKDLGGNSNTCKDPRVQE